MTTTPELLIKAGVRAAWESLGVAYPHIQMSAFPDGQGGLWVEFVDVPLGPAYEQDSTFLIFNLLFNLPGADIYPMFVRSDLSRVDGLPLGEGLTVTQLSWSGEPSSRPVVQLSRRTKGDFTLQTAAQKVAKVLHWLETR